MVSNSVCSASTCRRSKIEKKLQDCKEENIVAIYFFEQFHSPRCWKTVAQARKKYNEMTANKLEAVKEQILIRYLGLGIKEAHHPWSKGQHTYTADELLDHLMKKVIPLESELKRGKLPTEALMNFPPPPEQMNLGTTSELGENLFMIDEEQRQKAIDEANEEIEKREARGEGDMLEQKQDIVAPKIDGNLVKKKFKIEMMFEQMGNDGEKEMDWYYGVVVDIVNAKKRVVEIEWDDACLHEGDGKTTKQKLNVKMWNTKKPKAGAWRQYFPKKRCNDK